MNTARADDLLIRDLKTLGFEVKVNGKERHQRPQKDPAQAMLEQIHGEANNGSVYALQNFEIWCQKKGLNSEQILPDERQKELRETAKLMAPRVHKWEQEFPDKLEAAMAAKHSGDIKPMEHLLSEFEPLDKNSSKIRKLIKLVEKEIEAFYSQSH